MVKDRSSNRPKVVGKGSVTKRALVFSFGRSRCPREGDRPVAGQVWHSLKSRTRMLPVQLLGDVVMGAATDEGVREDIMTWPVHI